MNRVGRVAAVCGVGLSIVVALETTPRGQAFPKPTIQEGPVEIRGTVNVGNSPAVEARQSGQWTVRTDDQSSVGISTPSFIERGGVYEFRWSETDRWERYRVTERRTDGWVVAEAMYPAGPGRCYLNIARAVSIVRVDR